MNHVSYATIIYAKEHNNVHRVDNIDINIGATNKPTFNSPTFVQRIRVQSNSILSPAAIAQVHRSNIKHSRIYDGQLVWRSTFKGAIQNVVVTSILVVHIDGITSPSNC